jgi:two-component system LytT family response regulator
MNCLIIDDDELSRNGIKHLASQIDYLNVIGTASNAIEGLSILNKKKVDLLFLDIEMPEMSGLELLKSLKKPPLTILASSKKEYALEAFEYNVVDYILKPVAITRFVQAVTKAKEIFDTSSKQTVDLSSNEHVFIKSNSMLHRINIKEILWIEALGDYVTINTSEKKHIVHSTLKAIESKLPPEKFIRAHRSFIVFIDAIENIDDTCIVMGTKLIPIGAIYKENLIKKLNFL